MLQPWFLNPFFLFTLVARVLFRLRLSIWLPSIAIVIVSHFHTAFPHRLVFVHQQLSLFRLLPHFPYAVLICCSHLLFSISISPALLAFGIAKVFRARFFSKSHTPIVAAVHGLLSTDGTKSPARHYRFISDGHKQHKYKHGAAAPVPPRAPGRLKQQEKYGRLGRLGRRRRCHSDRCRGTDPNMPTS